MKNYAFNNAIGVLPRWLRQTLLVMRITTLILLAALVQVSASGLAQKISIDKKNVSIQTILNEISKQSGYDFFYDANALKKIKAISILIRDADLDDAIKKSLEGLPLSYSIDNRTVIIKEAEPTFLERLADRWAAIDVTGRVLDDQGNPLPGATVRVKDGKGAVVTDSQGRFLIENVKEGALVVISYTGYVSQEMEAKANMGVITLKLSENPLDQVQIIAYGTTTKRFATGNTTTITAKEIEKQPVNNVMVALQGRVPGLEITQANGIPGSSVKVQIQGRTNLTSFVASDPLIVVDGVPYPAQQLGTFQSGMVGNGILGGSVTENIPPGSTLSFLNPADIESIDVLKDADATAIYGSRAANGAVLITTKKGKAGDTRVDVDLQHGLGRVPIKLELLNTPKYLEMRREAKRNNHADISATDYDLNGLWDTTRYTDWQKEMIGGTAQFTRLSASISGGSATANYRIGSTYGRETSVFPGDFANTKGSLNFNVNGSDRKQRFQMSLTGSFMLDNNNVPGKDFTDFIFLAPNAPRLRNADGTLNWAKDANGNSSWTNPLSYNENIFEIQSYNLVTNLSASYKILPNLVLRANFGFNQLQSNQFLGALDASVKPEDLVVPNRSSITTRNMSRSWITEPQLNYRKEDFLGGSLEALLGATFQEQVSEGISVAAYGQSSDQLLRNLAAATGFIFGNDNSIYRYSGVFARLNYIAKDRYMLNFSARRDGSSRFGRNNIFANFGALGAGWIFSEEALVKKTLPWLSFGKLRGSYGLMGNDQIGDYRFMSLYNIGGGQASYQGIRSLVGGLSNPDLQWEETRKLQLGLDLGAINNRILINLTWFRNRTGNTLGDVNMPIIVGAPSIVTNFPALIQNSGWEFSLTTENIKSKNFSWMSTLNLTRPRNKLVAFPDLENSTSANDLVIGQPIGMTKTYSYYGVDPLSGRYLLRDTKGGLTTSPNSDTDQTVWLNRNQILYGGLQNNFEYNGLQLSFFLQYVQQKGFDFLQTGSTFPGIFNYYTSQQNQPVAVLDRWQKPGDQHTYARFSTSDSGFERGDLGFRNLPYLRLQNVSLSYQFQDRLMQRFKLKTLRVFLHGQNLFTWTNYHGLNPESKSRANSILPPLRLITLGGNIGF